MLILEVVQRHRDFTAVRPRLSDSVQFSILDQL